MGIRQGRTQMHFSHFVRYMNENGSYVPKAVRLDITRRGKERLIERFQADRADSELRFDDLIAEAEVYVSGAR